MTAGVQNSDPAAYLPAPRSSSSSASDPKGADALPDFQSELQLHDPDPKEKKTAGRPEKSSGKFEKNRDTPEKAPNLPALTPVQVAEPAKQILPLVLALPQPDEPDNEPPVKLEGSAGPEAFTRPEAFTTPDDQTKEPSRQGKQEVEQSSAVQLPNVPQSAKLPQPVGLQRRAIVPEPAEPPKSPVLAKPAELPQLVDPTQTVATLYQGEPSKPVERQERAENPPTVDLPKSVDPSTIGLHSTEPPPNPTLAVNPAAWATSDTLQAQIVQVAAELPVQKEVARNIDQAAIPAQPGASSLTQPISRGELRLAEAVLPEPIATASQETVDPAPSSPAALAFAARVAAAPQNADQSVPGNVVQPPAAAGSAASVRIPVRYAATAQILPSDSAKPGQGFKRDAGAPLDPAPRTECRTDMMLPRIETVPEAAPPSSGSAPPPQQAAPAARQEQIIEPPAAPPASAHNFSVRVPDNNGGSTQVRFVESGGEVRVSVRTADEGLAQNLRTHLNDLSQRLAEGGISAEIWKPAADSASSQNNNQHQPDRDGRGSNGQPSGGQDGQSDRQQKRPAWLEEMEASLHED